nr:hypothetical protein GCM10020093_102660 [Planobispora longispora]
MLSTFLDDLVGRYRAALEQGGDPRTVLSEMVRIGFSTLEPHRAAITVMQNDWNYLRSSPATASTTWSRRRRRSSACGSSRSSAARPPASSGETWTPSSPTA